MSGSASSDVKPNAFNSEKNRKDSSLSDSSDTDQVGPSDWTLRSQSGNWCRCQQKPRASSFKDSDKYVRTATGSFVRMDSDIYDRSGSGTMPDFRPALKVKESFPFSTYFRSHERREKLYKIVQWKSQLKLANQNFVPGASGKVQRWGSKRTDERSSWDL